MTISVFQQRPLVYALLLAAALGGVLPAPADAQIWKRLTQVAACGAGGYAGVKIGEEVAKFEAKRLNLSAADAAKHKKAFQIGIGLALCGGGAAIAGTTYSRLSKRGMESRQQEILKALEDSAPTPYAYVDPDTPSLQGVVVAQPAVVQGDQECRVIQDRLAGDEALVKYCKGSNGAWAVKAI